MPFGNVSKENTPTVYKIDLLDCIITHFVSPHTSLAWRTPSVINYYNYQNITIFSGETLNTTQKPKVLTDFCTILISTNGSRI